MIRLLCFDLDGTLVDSAQDIVNSVNRTLIEFGKEPLSREVVVSHIGEGLRVLLQGVFAAPPEGMTYEDLTKRFLDVYEEEMLKSTLPFPGVHEFLETWVKEGGKIGIITNKNETPAKVLLQHLKMDHFPWVEVFGADSLSERKPSALPLMTMMTLAGVKPEETLMIGDGTPDMASAQKAGVKAVAITFGYTKREILASYHPAAFLENYSHFPDVIAQLSGLKS